MDAAVEGGGTLFVPSVCLVELIYLVERDRLPESALAGLLDRLGDVDARLLVAPLDERVARAVRRIPRDLVPDMPDRIIAATAVALGLPLVTKDRRIRAAGLDTLW